MLVKIIVLLISFIQVKQQCDLKLPLEDRIRVMVRSNALKSPISTRLLPFTSYLQKLCIMRSLVLYATGETETS